jgi:hypothetical protein
VVSCSVALNLFQGPCLPIEYKDDLSSFAEKSRHGP